MSALISFAQQQAIKPLSANNQSKFERLSVEVENQLAPLVGVAMLQNLQDDPEDAANEKLLEGDTYTDTRTGYLIKHRGLRYVLAYLIYEAYVDDVAAADTFTGFVQKRHEQAEPVSAGVRSALKVGARNLALAEWERVKSYLCINAANYPFYEVPGKMRGGVKMYGVRNTKKHKS